MRKNLRRQFLLDRLQRLILGCVIFLFVVDAVAGKRLSDVQQSEMQVSGKVTAESGELLPGVNVILKGTTVGTVTDANGKYTLEYNHH